MFCSLHARSLLHALLAPNNHQPPVAQFLPMSQLDPGLSIPLILNDRSVVGRAVPDPFRCTEPFGGVWRVASHVIGEQQEWAGA